MAEKCPFCGALFTVTEVGGGGICGACREPIDCPYCNETVREERTTGFFKESLVKKPESRLSQHLGITDEEWDEMDVELNADTGSHDEMTYCYWFEVPEGTLQEILDKTGWKVGDVINGIPISVVDTE
ncbi:MULTISPECIES: hypothetical protein [Vibrio]|jgi:hypothetical protein|uniref:hypothetical protein n=1 Tax=Vibrio TaxID=662 RepID=UPI001B81C97C|nr:MULTISPECIES: hypothetical protein [Vibrio]HCG8549212.1 hypothetical protein [Vibrio parahaemolyticus]EJS2611611.1 hypothetical protein [Vibrio alginolyticus]MCA2452968.1 hypothetical protein [Vibrio alginolyticus]MCA2476853.1 hypothetical protein [Vibrio alginolyticus]MCF7456180.1 hypothetical protein [Vibrio sp. A1-1]